MPVRTPFSRGLCALSALVALSASQVRADDIAVESERVTLAMILPALEGTDLGSLDLAASPLPGESQVIRASDVKAKIKESGRDARGLAIPKSTRVVRHAQRIETSALDGLVRQALAPRVAPCAIDQLSALPALTVAAGEFELEAEPLPRKASGRTNVALSLRQGDRTQRISMQAVLHCPEPVIMPGANVKIVARVGHVSVTAPGVAAQPGRIGDEIRVTNQITKKSMKGRVIDAQSVEVVQ
jgi:hypothetical protein